MEIVRPIREEDFPGLLALAKERGKGIANLPRDPEALKKKIQNSLKAFSPHNQTPSFCSYLFVMEDLHSTEIIGTCSIVSKKGGKYPLCLYRIEEERHPLRHSSHLLCLHPHCQPEGPTEVCALYLKKNAREKGLGRLLSLSRFLFIRTFPERFTETIAAQMRGLVTEEGQYFFWENFGRLFYDISGDEANQILVYQPEKVPEILPAYPIYLCLIPPKVQNLLHETHVNTKPAMYMLQEEGFHYKNEIDAIDGGPRMIAKRGDIRSIQQSRKETVMEIRPESEEPNEHLIANDLLDFRCCLGRVESAGKGVVIDRKTAECLQIRIGDMITFVESKGVKNGS